MDFTVHSSDLVRLLSLERAVQTYWDIKHKKKVRGGGFFWYISKIKKNMKDKRRLAINDIFIKYLF